MAWLGHIGDLQTQTVCLLPHTGPFTDADSELLRVELSLRSLDREDRVQLRAKRPSHLTLCVVSLSHPGYLGMPTVFRKFIP